MERKAIQIADRVVAGLDQTFRMAGQRKKALALELLPDFLAEEGIELEASQLDKLVEQSVRRRRLALPLRRSWRALTTLFGLFAWPP